MTSHVDGEPLRIHFLRDRLGWWGIGMVGERLAGLVLPERGRERPAEVLRRRAQAMGLRAVEGGEPPRRIAQAIRGWVAGRPSARPPALDLRGVSPFDRRVLRVVARIPFGERWSYGRVAERIGRRGAARAVGGALGRNPVPLFVPCHRVVRATGGLGGFSASGGPRLKEWMLDHERSEGTRA